ncbi:MAG: hypothetical protein AB4041_08630 [Microcystaceae cyanobacterium]
MRIYSLNVWGKFRYTIETIGLSGPRITDAIPTNLFSGDFNQQSYTEIVNVIQKVKEAYDDSSTTVSPVILGISIPTEPNLVYIESLARVHALRSIRDGNTCNEAKNSLPNSNLSRISKKIVERTYQTIADGCPVFRMIRPNEEARIRANNLLSQFSIE